MESIDCRRIQNELDRLFAEDVEPEVHERIEAHLEGCEDCREHRALLEEISGAYVAEPSDAELAGMRSEVLTTIRRERRAGWLRLPYAAAIAAVAGGALLLALGWGAGRATAPAPTSQQAAAVNPDFALARQIQREARESQARTDVDSARFRYANVRIEEQPGDQIHLAFDVSRHLELTLPKSDPLVTEVLVQSVLEAGSVGTQLEAIEQAENVVEPRVRAALVQAMLHDPNLGVRLQAQARLVERPGDPATSQALLTVLEKEESVQMRLVAIDYLAQSRTVDAQRLRQAVEAGEPEGRPAVRVRADELLLSSL